MYTCTELVHFLMQHLELNETSGLATHMPPWALALDYAIAAATRPDPGGRAVGSSVDRLEKALAAVKRYEDPGIVRVYPDVGSGPDFARAYWKTPVAASDVEGYQVPKTQQSRGEVDSDTSCFGRTITGNGPQVNSRVFPQCYRYPISNWVNPTTTRSKTRTHRALTRRRPAR